MHPALTEDVASGTAFLVLAIVAGTVMSVYRARKTSVGSGKFVVALLYMSVVALLGAKLYGLVERHGVLLPFRAEVVSGYRYPGGILGLVVALTGVAGWVGLSYGELADLISPSVMLAMGVTRIGCFLAGCCSGSVTDLPWAVRFPMHSLPWTAQVKAGLLDGTSPFSLPVHPLQLYFGVLAILIMATCFYLEPVKRFSGQLLVTMIASYGIGQFLLEYLRFSPLPHIQYAALAGGLVGSVVLMSKLGIFALNRLPA